MSTFFLGVIIGCFIGAAVCICAVGLILIGEE